MARGWESKSIESQIETASDRATGTAAARALAPDELTRRAQRESLLLSRVRVSHDLECARHPRHKEMLLRALAHLDQKLAELG